MPIGRVIGLTGKAGDYLLSLGLVHRVHSALYCARAEIFLGEAPERTHCSLLVLKGNLISRRETDFIYSLIVIAQGQMVLN